jgi:hypothetical protein
MLHKLLKNNCNRELFESRKPTSSDHQPWPLTRFKVTLRVDTIKFNAISRK